jgi:mannonate dehydratase
MKQGWRWYGPADPVTLDHVRQAGASDVVTALHHIYDGRAWTVDDVLRHKALVEAAGLTWSVCESIPTHSSIKTRTGPYRRYIDAWKDSLASLGRAGIPTVCYNFMPVVDWTRTELAHRLPTTGYALRFDMVDFIAYDVLVLKRHDAEASYPPEPLAAAQRRFAAMDEAAILALERNIIAGLPGGEGIHTRRSIRAEIEEFAAIDAAAMRQNLIAFMREVVPVADEVGVKLGIHPDDPPFPLFGLPRVMSRIEDCRALLAAVDSPANGFTFCTGSYGARADNDLLAMIEELAPRIHFVHLRNVKREPDGSFYEAEHLEGDTDMVRVITALMAEEHRRRGEGRPDAAMTMRPDHGHVIVDDIGKRTNPGYSCIGRLKGLAELRGIMRTVEAYGLATAPR